MTWSNCRSSSAEQRTQAPSSRFQTNALISSGIRSRRDVSMSSSRALIFRSRPSFESARLLRSQSRSATSSGDIPRSVQYRPERVHHSSRCPSELIRAAPVVLTCASARSKLERVSWKNLVFVVKNRYAVKIQKPVRSNRPPDTLRRLKVYPLLVSDRKLTGTAPDRIRLTPAPGTNRSAIPRQHPIPVPNTASGSRILVSTIHRSDLDYRSTLSWLACASRTAAACDWLVGRSECARSRDHRRCSPRSARAPARRAR